MKKAILVGLILSTVTYVPLTFAHEHEEAGEHHYLKSSVITTKVKSKLAAKHLSSLTHVKVDTDKDGVVWLSGRAPSQDAVDMATAIAKDTEGVSSVHNDIAVQPRP